MINIWRKDITGLRALAVVPVLLYHAFPSLMPGGFYGVDIFFVISGYLISGIIFRGLFLDSFSFCDFYSKRIKRIVPNLLLVLFFVVIVGWFVSTADEYRKIGGNVTHSAFFYQNFTLMKDDDYFGVDAKNNPLLHIWSLAIEEQFYLLFPFMAFLIWRLGRRSISWLGIFVLFITLASFASCLWISEQKVRFYLPFSRFWELGLGICIAYAETFFKVNVTNYGKRVGSFLSVLGIFLILLSIFCPNSLYAPPPGLFSLVPVLGATCLIFAGANAMMNRTVLSWRCFSFVGLISYSLYLWHWPILAYVNVYFYKPEIWVVSLALGLSFFVSVLVYYFVENPIRRIDKKYNRLCVTLLMLGLGAAFIAGKVIREEGGIPDREIAQVMSHTDDWSWGEGLTRSKLNDNLKVLKVQEVPEIIFLGDSHAQQYQSRAAKLAKESGKNVGFMTDGGCLISIGKNKNGKACWNAKQELNEIFKKPDVKILVIGQMWGSYSDSLLKRGVAEYSELISKFLASGESRKVYVLLDNPWDESDNDEFNIEKHFESRFNIKEKMKKEYMVTMPINDAWERGNQFVEGVLMDKVTFIESSSYICPNGICNLKFYKDEDHLRSSYVYKNATWIDQVFE